MQSEASYIPAGHKADSEYLFVVSLPGWALVVLKEQAHDFILW